MKASALIEQLQAHITKNGDLPVVCVPSPTPEHYKDFDVNDGIEIAVTTVWRPAAGDVLRTASYDDAGSTGHNLYHVDEPRILLFPE